MPSFRVCLFSSGREVCRWSLGWRCAYRLGVQLSCFSTARFIEVTVDEFVSFRNKSDNKDVAKFLWSQKAGLLVDICLQWSYDLYDRKVAP